MSHEQEFTALHIWRTFTNYASILQSLILQILDYDITDCNTADCNIVDSNISFARLDLVDIVEKKLFQDCLIKGCLK